MGSLIRFWKNPCWVLVLLSISGIWGGEGTVAAATDCSTVLVGLVPCLPYVQGNASSPVTKCCKDLKSITVSHAICLCTFDSFANGIYIDPTLALQLPALCNISIDLISYCSASSPSLPSSLNGSAASRGASSPYTLSTPESSPGVPSAAPSLAISTGGVTKIHPFIFFYRLSTTALLLAAAIDFS